MSEQIALEKLRWRDVSETFHQLNPRLAALIDAIDPPDECVFYRAQYRYGDRFLDKGNFKVPRTDGSLVSLMDDSADRTLQDHLSYNMHTNPVMFITKKVMELYVETEDQVIPFLIAKPGKISGLSRLLDTERAQNTLTHTSNFLWDMTAGARSVFILPKISDNVAHTKLLKNFGISTEKPRELKDHWRVFRALARSREFENHSDWRFETLFFSKHWFEHLDDPAWRELKMHWMIDNRRDYAFWHNYITWQLTFSRIKQIKNIKASPHMLDTVKHLFTLACGEAIGFAPNNENLMMPTQQIQQAYLDYYGINYDPCIMQPTLLNITDPKPIYYSLQYPTAVEYSPKSSGGTSTINDLDDLILLISKFTKQITQPTLNLENTILENITKQLDLSFYHTNPENYDSILPSNTLPESDLRFNTGLVEPGTLEFAKNSTFVKGCVKVDLKMPIDPKEPLKATTNESAQ